MIYQQSEEHLLNFIALYTGILYFSETSARNYILTQNKISIKTTWKNLTNIKKIMPAYQIDLEKW